MTLINVFHGSSGIPFYSQYLEAKVIMNGLSILISRLWKNYFSYKDRMEEVNQFRENKLEITPYAEYKYGISKSPPKDFILDIILIPFLWSLPFPPRPRGFRVNPKNG